MKIEDSGFIVFTKQYGESALLLKVLSKENGLISGYVNHTKKNKLDYQIGNLVKFTWSAKNINQLGTLKIEIIKSYLSILVNDKFYLSIVDNMTSLINNLLYERYLENNLFFVIENILNFMLQNVDKKQIIKEYLIFENTILNIIGSGIIFDNLCPFEELFYISPKTGLAVSKTKGEPYKEKLFLFPKIFKNDDFSKENIIECFDIIDYFLKKYLVENNLINKSKILLILRDNIISNI